MFLKKQRLPILVLIVTVGLVVAVEVSAPEPIDWTTNYALDDRRPFGSKILYELLPDLFPDQSIRTSYQTLYEQQDSLVPGNLLFIGSSFLPEEEDLTTLLEQVADGSTAFIATTNLSEKLEDTLNCRTRSYFFLSDTVSASLTDIRLKVKMPYEFKKIKNMYGFMLVDSAKTIRFETLGINQTEEPNFIRLPWGKGWFYLHCMPEAYTNYNMLAGRNKEYIEKTLSYLPVQPVYWDEYYKGNIRELRTPLRFILVTPALRWALFLSLAGIVIFVLFEAKRRQRIVPVVPPLANTTLEFTQTVGRLYFQHRDHRNIAEKKILFFLDHIRSVYFVQTSSFDSEFYDKLVQKTGHSREEIVKLFQLIQYCRHQAAIPEEVLLELNNRIEKFMRKPDTLTSTQNIKKASNSALAE